jgi:hypothetical protein
MIPPGSRTPTTNTDWAGEYGYDTDSRKAEKTFRACQRQRAKLFAFLGPELYQTLLWDTERD